MRERREDEPRSLSSLDCSFVVTRAGATSSSSTTKDDAEISSFETSKSSVLSVANGPADNANTPNQPANHTYNGNTSGRGLVERSRGG
jgi:hypothetical protein